MGAEPRTVAQLLDGRARGPRRGGQPHATHEEQRHEGRGDRHRHDQRRHGEQQPADGRADHERRHLDRDEELGDPLGVPAGRGRHRGRQSRVRRGGQRDRRGRQDHGREGLVSREGDGDEREQHETTDDRGPDDEVATEPVADPADPPRADDVRRQPGGGGQPEQRRIVRALPDQHEQPGHGSDSARRQRVAASRRTTGGRIWRASGRADTMDGRPLAGPLRVRTRGGRDVSQEGAARPQIPGYAVRAAVRHRRPGGRRHRRRRHGLPAGDPEDGGDQEHQEAQPAQSQRQEDAEEDRGEHHPDVRQRRDPAGTGAVAAEREPPVPVSNVARQRHSPYVAARSASGTGPPPRSCRRPGSGRCPARRRRAGRGG